MRSFLIFFLFLQIYIALSNVPIFIMAKKTPPGSIYNLVDVDRFGDYNGYLAAMTMGKHRQIIFRNPYTTEKSFFNLYYLPYTLFGFMTSPLSLSSDILYHLLKIICAEFFGVSIFFLCQTVLKKYLRLLGSIIVLTSTSMPIAVFSILGIPISSDFWKMQDAITRLSSAPHHLLGIGLLIFSASLFFSLLKEKTAKKIACLSLTSFITGIIFTPALLPLLFLFFFGSVYLFIESKKDIKKSSLFMWPLLSGFLSLILSFIILQTGYHKQIWSTWEVARWNLDEPFFDIIFFLSQGIYALFLPILIIYMLLEFKVIKKESLFLFFLFLWALLPFLIIPFATVLGFSKIRLYAMVPFVPAGTCLMYLISKLNKKIHIILSVLIIIFFTETSLSLFTIHINKLEQMPVYSNIFIPQKKWKAVEFIQSEAPKNSIILSNEQMGNIIPSFAPVISYFGHINMTIHFKEKQENVWKFYTGQMTQNEAHEFVRENVISYIVWGPDEKELGKSEFPYPAYKKVFENSEIAIYKI